MMDQASVMIIDDDEEFLEETAEMLGYAGYKTRTASEAAQALSSIFESPPDVVLLDIKMPINGLTLVRKLKEAEETAGIPIIVISGYLDREVLDDFERKTDVSDILEKPLNPLDLIKSIEVNLNSL